MVASDLKGAGDRLFYSVTRDAAKGIVYLKMVNASSSPQELKIALDGAKSVGASAKLVRLSGGRDGGDQHHRRPDARGAVESAVKGVGKEFTRTMPGYSIDVMELAVQ